MPIFDDCIVCGEIRKHNKATIVTMRGKRNRVSIIECICSRSITHESLLAEVELIDFFAAAGIII